MVHSAPAGWKGACPIHFAQCPGWPQGFTSVFDTQQKELKAFHLNGNYLPKPHTSPSDAHPRTAEGHWGTDTVGRSLPCQPRPNLNVDDSEISWNTLRPLLSVSGNPGTFQEKPSTECLKVCDPCTFQILLRLNFMLQAARGWLKGVIPWGWA